MSITEEMSQNFVCKERLFLEFGPLEFALKYKKYKIAEDIHTNCAIHFEN